MDSPAPLPSPVSTPTSRKEELRQTLRERRRRLSGQEQHTAAAALANQVLRWLQAAPDTGCIAAYLSVPPEPGTGELLPALTAAGYDVVVPVCEAQYQMSWVSWKPGVELAKSPRAPLWEPVGERRHFTAVMPFRLVLVPGLGMDVRGNRIGQGGGYYDRFLAQLRLEQPDADRLGYVYDEELLAPGIIETTPLDMPLNGVFTPSGLHSVG
ncbi:5-formyltetrahydrofolate cyclo-ligase [Arthrobacter subterraneus]|uniref:5-formyltetrahydrofolate cyclo-ligase n=1 Tax=Arthrobacter subterraneus TaxID=335973 RepID=A0A1G8C6R7_9MICC|nr:5-formyltetrahydrofolate cyclo-ligase [Arthrobacter subterraneus]SDH41211.1 5-formyltetrahydrofolate cyclo-ligase [Arthrobacter subterraneus]